MKVIESPNGIEIRDRFLVFAPKAKVVFEAWRTMLIDLLKAEENCKFYIGDLLNYGTAEYGEKYAWFVKDVRLREQTLRVWCSISKALPPSIRGYDLTWSHYREVAALDRSKQKRFLQQAEALGWSVQDLRDAIRSTDIIEDDDSAVSLFDVATIRQMIHTGRKVGQQTSDAKLSAMSPTSLQHWRTLTEPFAEAHKRVCARLGA